MEKKKHYDGGHITQTKGRRRITKLLTKLKNYASK